MSGIKGGVRNRWQIVAVVGLIAALSGCAATGGAEEADLERRVAQATTPADHLALAEYFDRRAAVAERQRDEWQALRKYYERTPASTFYPIGTVPGMLSHYDQLIQDEESSARQCRALGQLHRGLGDDAAGRREAR